MDPRNGCRVGLPVFRDLPADAVKHKNIPGGHVGERSTAQGVGFGGLAHGGCQPGVGEWHSRSAIDRAARRHSLGGKRVAPDAIERILALDLGLPLPHAYKDLRPVVLTNDVIEKAVIGDIKLHFAKTSVVEFRPRLFGFVERWPRENNGQLDGAAPKSGF